MKLLCRLLTCGCVSLYHCAAIFTHVTCAFCMISTPVEQAVVAPSVRRTRSLAAPPRAASGVRVDRARDGHDPLRHARVRLAPRLPPSAACCEAPACAAPAAAAADVSAGERARLIGVRLKKSFRLVYFSCAGATVTRVNVRWTASAAQARLEHATHVMRAISPVCLS